MATIPFPNWKVDSLGPPTADYGAMLRGIGESFEGSYERARKRTLADQAAEAAKKYGYLLGPGGQVLGGGVGGGVVAGGSTVGPGTAVSKADGTTMQRATELAKYLVDTHGLSREAASAIAGHAVEESAVRATGPAGDAGRSRAMFQWDPTRYGNMIAWARSQGKDPTDWRTQADYAVVEAGTGHGGNILGALRAPGVTTKQATDLWFGFERPGGWKPGNPTGVPSYGSRQAHASRIYNALGEVAPTESAQAGVPVGTAPGTTVSTPAPRPRPVPLPAGAVTTSSGTLAPRPGFEPPAQPAPAPTLAPTVGSAGPRLLPQLPELGLQQAALPPGPPTASLGNAPIGVPGGNEGVPAAPAVPGAGVVAGPGVPAPAPAVAPGSPLPVSEAQVSPGARPERSTPVVGGPDERLVPIAEPPPKPTPKPGVDPTTTGTISGGGLSVGGGYLHPELLAALIRNPDTAAAAVGLLNNQLSRENKPQVQEVNGVLYQHDPRTGKWVPVAGQSKGPETKEVGGQLFERQPDGSWKPVAGQGKVEAREVNGQIFEKQPDGTWKPVTAAKPGEVRTIDNKLLQQQPDGTWKPVYEAPSGHVIVNPDDKEGRAKYKIPPGDTRSYQVDTATNKAEPINPAPDSKTFEKEKGLREEFESQQRNKEFYTVDSNYKRMQTGLNDPIGPSDATIAYSYLKMLDPATGVKEGEKADLGKLSGRAQQAGALYNQVVGGGGLTDVQRQEILTAARRIYASEAKSYNERANLHRSRAKDYGVEPDRVIKTVEEPDLKKEIKVTRTIAGSGTQNRPYRFTNPAEFDRSKIPPGKFYYDEQGQLRKKPEEEGD